MKGGLYMVSLLKRKKDETSHDNSNEKEKLKEAKAKIKEQKKAEKAENKKEMLVPLMRQVRAISKPLQLLNREIVTVQYLKLSTHTV